MLSSSPSELRAGGRLTAFEGYADQLRSHDGERDASLCEFVDAFELETGAFDCRASLAIEVTAVVDRFPQPVEIVHSVSANTTLSKLSAANGNCSAGLSTSCTVTPSCTAL